MEKAPQLSSDQEKPDEDRRSAARRIGESAVANMPSNYEGNFNYSGKFNVANTREYLKDRSKENIDMLEQLGDAHMVKLYKNLMYRYPQLKCIRLVNDKEQNDNAFFSCAGDEDRSSYYPSIHYNFSNKSTYIFRSEQNLEEEITPSNDRRLGRKIKAKRLAFSAGADWKKCVKNQNLMADSVFLHEFGHGYDFIENYFRPQYNALNGENRGPTALYRAQKLSHANRNEYSLQSPDGVFGALKRGSDAWKKSELRLRAMGINNYDEYAYARYQYYHDQPDESFADNFANNYIMLYYDNYFTSNPRDHEKVYTTGETKISLDKDFVHIMGLKQGTGLEVSRLDKKRKSQDHFTGFLASNMYVGKQLYLYENGDPKKPGRKWGGFGAGSQIAEITLEPKRDKKTGKIHHYVFLKTANGDEYHISRTWQEPETVSCSPQELSQDLGLKKGDKVQLIEHLARDARRMNFSKVTEKDGDTKMIEGVVEQISGNQAGRNVTISYQDSYNITRRHYLSLPVKRKWTRFYVGNYEVLPLPD